jgi:hypothetical protein
MWGLKRVQRDDFETGLNRAEFGFHFEIGSGIKTFSIKDFKFKIEMSTIVAIVSANRAEEGGFESRQILSLLGQWCSL